MGSVVYGRPIPQCRSWEPKICWSRPSPWTVEGKVKKVVIPLIYPVICQSNFAPGWGNYFSFSILPKHFPSKLIFLKYIFLLEREREIERQRDREAHRCERKTLICASCTYPDHMHPTGDWAPKQGLCPDWKLNQKHFGVWYDAHPTEQHWPELTFILVNIPKSFSSICKHCFFKVTLDIFQFGLKRTSYEQ